MELKLHCLYKTSIAFKCLDTVSRDARFRLKPRLESSLLCSSQSVVFTICSGSAIMERVTARAPVCPATILKYRMAEIIKLAGNTVHRTTTIRRPASSPDTSSWLLLRSSTSCWVASSSPMEESCPTPRPSCCSRRLKATSQPRPSKLDLFI
ncbi:unnamed protein product [Staurois parvus]|uniref:Uncharacterized protein n=1 Tax=Staurois parvus TaxID=386267 RepID=A0ABN9BQV2_9NEOB|nr:unnamed protein product [Staurois parvus]